MPIERESIFGRKHLSEEQLLFSSVVDHSGRGLFLIDPKIIGIDFPTHLIPAERRKLRAKEHFQKALDTLNEFM